LFQQIVITLVLFDLQWPHLAR